MKILYDAAKRDQVLLKRNLDFDDASEIFENFHVTRTDIRKNYGEDREITVGMIDGQVIIVVWTKRDDGRRIITMWKAGNDDQEEFLNARAEHLD